MKLFYAAASPFARKVLIVAHELGVIDRIEIVDVVAHPVDQNQEVMAVNPVAKIPTLVLDDGTAVFDSRVICAYLDGLAADASVYPQGEAHLDAMVLQALGDAAMDAAVLLRYEQFVRPEALRWAEWADGQANKINKSLDDLEANRLDSLAGPVTIGQIAIACALGYVDFRHGSLDWPTGRPGLKAWYDAFSERPSMRATVPSG